MAFEAGVRKTQTVMRSETGVAVAIDAGGRTATALPTNVPFQTIPVTGARSFLATKAVDAFSAPSLLSGLPGPYAIGGQTLNVKVGAVTTTVTFTAVSLTKGTSVSDINPSVDLGGGQQMNVSVDGGAITEISINNNEVGGANIAALIQIEIRASVPNGALVVMDFGVTNPGKYTITSGTAGNGSSIIITDSIGNKNMAPLLRLGVANSGIEIPGQGLNSLTTQDAVDAINAQVADVSATVESGKVRITSSFNGATSTLQITAGGTATAAFNFPPGEVLGGTGSGAANLAVNGLTTPTIYEIPKHPTKTFHVTRIVFEIVDALADNSKFGGLAELVNGLLVETQNAGEPLQEWFVLKTNGQLLARARAGGTIVINALGGEDIVRAEMLVMEPGFPLVPSTPDKIIFTVRDDLSGLTSFEIIAEGWLE